MALTPFSLPLYTGQVLPNGEAVTSLKPPAIIQGGQYNPHAYAQADAMQALKQAFAPQPYMPWFAQQAPAADWNRTYNTGAWMPPWVMTPGNVSTKGTNLSLGGMFGYQGNYGASPGPGIGGGTWGGVPGTNPLNPVRPPTSVPGATYPGIRNTEPVIQQPDGSYIPGVDPNTGPATTVDKGTKNPGVTGGGTYTGYGASGNTAQQNYDAARAAGNPLPPPTGPDAPSDVYGFLDAFTFSNPSSPEQTRFNSLASQYGPNDAWSWAMSNAWNQLGPSLRNAMDSAGLSADDRNRIINTYGARTKDLGDEYNYSSNWLANAFGGFVPVVG